MTENQAYAYGRRSPKNAPALHFSAIKTALDKFLHWFAPNAS
jgi:hypothetical protein